MALKNVDAEAQKLLGVELEKRSILSWEKI